MRTPRQWRGVAVVVVCALMIVSRAVDLAAQEGMVSREYAIKAGVLGVLGKCVIWPDGAGPNRDEPLVIGVVGKDPFIENGVNQLERMAADESRKGIKIAVKRFVSMKDYQPCHILFVSQATADASVEKSAAERVAAANNRVQGQAVLIVGESNGLAQRGAVANLMFDAATNLIRLELNPDAAARARLKLAPDLLRLKLVQIVRDTNVR
jgi:hypothetical protein